MDNCKKRALWPSVSLSHLNRREKGQDLKKTLLKMVINETRKYVHVMGQSVIFVLTWKANKKENTQSFCCHEIEETTN